MAGETILQMRERRNAVAQKARELVEKNPGASWKPEHGEKFDALNTEIEVIDSEIKRNEKVLQLDADRAFDDAAHERGGAARNGMTAFLRNGYEGMSEDERADLRANMKLEKGGYHFTPRNTLSGDPANPTQGGSTVQTDVVTSIVEKLKAFGGMRSVAEVIKTSGGEAIQFPTSDGTSETGEIVAENASATAADPTTSSTTLGVQKFSSKIVAVPWELLQDSQVNIDEWITKRLATRLGRIQNTKFTVGTGTAEPKGAVTAASAGKVGLTGQTGTVIFDDLIDLQHSVDPAYREQGKCRFMFHDTTLQVLRKLKDSQGRPIFLPGYYDNGIAAGIPDTLVGSPFTINQDMPTMAANAKSILFGDFGYYVIRDVMGLTLFRFSDSAYASKGQVGFLAWMRSGGNLIDAGGALRYYQNSAT
jgi:HK97 family phage major capsid protein